MWTIHNDNSVSVEDNGRGIPVGIPQDRGGVPAVEVVLTKLHAGGKFDNDSYKVSGGLHGVWVFPSSTPLSKFLEVEIFQNGKIYHQTYEKGVKTSELIVKGETSARGSKIHFFPDADIFTTDHFSFEILSRRLRELAFLNKGVEISIKDNRTEESDTFLYEGGLESFVDYLNKRHSVIHPAVFFEGVKSDVQIEVAMQYNDTFKEKNSDIRQQHQYPGGWLSPHWIQGGTDEIDQPICQQRDAPEKHAGQNYRGRYSRGTDGHHQRQTQKPAI